MSRVLVVVRCRPLNAREKNMGAKVIVRMKGNTTYLKDESGNERPFNFDASFWSANPDDAHFADQQKVFEVAGRPVIANAYDGFHCCIFAYGQTGSGKSFSMMGYNSPKHLQGIIPRLCNELFDRVKESKAKAEAASDDDIKVLYKVEVSYLEIYNEKVRDLLGAGGPDKDMKVREHPKHGPYVEGLTITPVSTFEEVENLITQGSKLRMVASTKMNAESSRSHAIFQLKFTQTSVNSATANATDRVSKISLVDLAGSERQDKTGAKGQQLTEAKNINQSLSTLGLVIKALAARTGGAEKFVPYRQSILTWLLKESLGGNSKTVMVAALSPGQGEYAETLSTLRYADNAKKIVNKAVVNEDPNLAMIKQLKDEVKKLKQMLAAAGLLEDGEVPSMPEAQVVEKEVIVYKEDEASKAELAKMEIQRKAREQFFQDQQAKWAAQVSEAAEKAKAEAAATLAAQTAQMQAQLEAAEAAAKAAAELAAQAQAAHGSGGGTKTEIQIVYRDAVVEATRNNPAAGLRTAVNRLEKLLIRKGKGDPDVEALHEKALETQRLQMQLQTGKLLPKIIEANSYAKIFVKPVVFSLASTSVEPWLLGSDLATIANEGSAEQQESGGHARAALDVVVTNIFTKVQQLWNVGDFMMAVGNMRGVYQRFKDNGENTVTPASLGTVIPDPFYKKPTAALFARGIVFVTGTQGLLDVNPTSPIRWIRHVGLIDAQARRCGDVTLQFEYFGKSVAEPNGDDDEAKNDDDNAEPLHRVRIAVEKLTLCSTRDAEESARTLDAINNSHSLDLSLRLSQFPAAAAHNGIDEEEDVGGRKSSYPTTMYHFDSISGPALRSPELIIPEAQSPLRGDEVSEVGDASDFFSGIQSGNGDEPASSKKLTSSADGVTVADAKEASAVWAQRKQLQSEADEHDAQVRALTGQIASRRTELTAARQAQHDVVAVRPGTPAAATGRTPQKTRPSFASAEARVAAFREKFANSANSARSPGDGVLRGSKKKKSKKGTTTTAKLTKMQVQLETMSKTIKNALKAEAAKLKDARAALQKAVAAAAATADGSSGGGGAPSASSSSGGKSRATQWEPPVMGKNVTPGTRVRVKQSSGEQVVGVVRFVGTTEFYHGTWVGVELDNAVGKNNGTVMNKTYFTCADHHGVFVQPSAIVSVQAPRKPTEGDVVTIKRDSGTVRGTVRFFGTTDFYEGLWVGVELDKKLGKNNGTVKDRAYFSCEPEHGLFVRPTEIEFVDSDDAGSSSPAGDDAPGTSSAELEALRASVEKREATIAAGNKRLTELGKQLEKERKKAAAAAAFSEKGEAAKEDKAADAGSDANAELLPLFGVGDRVKVRQADGSIVKGWVQYYGKTGFYEGMWVGVVLDTAAGKNNGTVLKRQYFQCRDNHGVFVQPHAVTLLQARPRPEVLLPGKLVEFRRPLQRKAITSAPLTAMGVVRFGGPVQALGGKNRVGIELFEPIGNCDGSVGQERLFACAPKHGVFVPAEDVYDILTLDQVVDRLSVSGGVLAAAAEAAAAASEPIEDPNAPSDTLAEVAADRVAAVEAEVAALGEQMKTAASKAEEARQRLADLEEPTISEADCQRVLGPGADSIETKVDDAPFVPAGLRETLVPQGRICAVFHNLKYRGKSHVELRLSDQDFLLLSSPQGSLQLELMQTLKDQQFVYNEFAKQAGSSDYHKQFRMVKRDADSKRSQPPVLDPRTHNFFVVVDILQENARKATGSLYNFVEYEPEETETAGTATPGRAGVSVIIENGSPKSPSSRAREKQRERVVVPGVFQLRDAACNSAFRIQIYQADKHQFCIESFNGITVGDVRQMGAAKGSGAGRLHPAFSSNMPLRCRPPLLEEQKRLFAVNIEWPPAYAVGTALEPMDKDAVLEIPLTFSFTVAGMVEPVTVKRTLRARIRKSNLFKKLGFGFQQQSTALPQRSLQIGSHIGVSILGGEKVPFAGAKEPDDPHLRSVAHAWKGAVDRLHVHYRLMRRRFEYEAVRDFHHQVGTALALSHSPLDEEEAKKLYSLAESLAEDSEVAFQTADDDEFNESGFITPTARSPRSSSNSTPHSGFKAGSAVSRRTSLHMSTPSSNSGSPRPLNASDAADLPSIYCIGRSDSSRYMLDVVDHCDPLVGQTGYMLKRGEKIKKFNRRWFVLQYPHLLYWETKKHSTMVPARGSIVVTECRVIESAAQPDHDDEEEISFVIQSPHERWELQANSSKEMREWVEALTSWHR